MTLDDLFGSLSSVRGDDEGGVLLLVSQDEDASCGAVALA